MTCSQEFYMSILLWVSLTFYLLAIFPQILLNKRQKSVAGLSDVYLFTIFSGYIAETYYVLCLGFHTAYMLLVPLAGLNILVMIIQRFYYHSPRTVPKLCALYLVTTIASLALIPFAYTHSQQVGHIMGWIAACAWSTYQLPQIAKNTLKKSVSGFSFGFATILGCASFCECLGAITLGLPLQTMLNGLLGLCMFIIFCFQFWRYRHND